MSEDRGVESVSSSSLNGIGQQRNCWRNGFDTGINKICKPKQSPYMISFI